MAMGVSIIGLIVLVVGGLLVLGLLFGLFWWLAGLGRKDHE